MFRLTLTSSLAEEASGKMEAAWAGVSGNTACTAAGRAAAEHAAPAEHAMPWSSALLEGSSEDVLLRDNSGI